MTKIDLEKNAGPAIMAGSNINKPDTAILLNLQFCLVISIPLFIIFCLVRNHIFRVYDANLQNNNR